MPHDKFGQELKLGDDVIVRGVVTNITQSDGYCNIGVETEELMYPSNEKTMLWLNSQQVESQKDDYDE